MKRGGVMKKRIGWMLLVLCATTSALAQTREIIVDWRAKRMTQYPKVIDRDESVVVRITNVNDLLYAYNGRLIARPITQDSVSISDIETRILSMTDDQACTDLVKRVDDALKQNFTLDTTKEPVESRPLGDSLAHWRAIAADAGQLIEGKDLTCDAFKNFKKIEILKTLARIAAGPHEFEFRDTLQPGNAYDVEITETYNGKPTTASGTKFSLTPGSSQFFLSVGYLVTQLQSRSYDSVAVGTRTVTTGTTTSEQAINELRIQGTGRFRPAAAFLLNYKLPVDKLMSNKFGAALSVGPVFKALNSQSGSTASNWGIFAGASIHLWERFWITPGFHFGEFADMPLGFTIQSRIIPPGLANPITGVNRSTTRWGIGLTFRAADFLKIPAKPKPAQAPAATPAATPAKAPAAAATPAAGEAGTTPTPAPGPATPQVSNTVPSTQTLEVSRALLVDAERAYVEAETAATSAALERTAAQQSQDRADQDVVARQAEANAAQEELRRGSRAWAADKSPVNEKRLAEAVASNKAADESIAQARAKAVEARTATLNSTAKSSAAAGKLESIKTRRDELRKLVDNKLK